PCETIICAQNVPWTSKTKMCAYYHYPFFKDAPLKMKLSRKEVLNALDRNYRKVIDMFAYIPGSNEVLIEDQKIITLHGKGSKKLAVDTCLSAESLLKKDTRSGFDLTTTAGRLVGKPVFTLGTEMIKGHPGSAHLTITLPLKEAHMTRGKGLSQLDAFQSMLDSLDQRKPLALDSMVKQIAVTPPFKKSHFSTLFASIVHVQAAEEEKKQALPNCPSHVVGEAFKRINQEGLDLDMETFVKIDPRKVAIILSKYMDEAYSQESIQKAYLEIFAVDKAGINADVDFEEAIRPPIYSPEQFNYVVQRFGALDQTGQIDIFTLGQMDVEERIALLKPLLKHDELIKLLDLSEEALTKISQDLDELLWNGY
ncbi:hypothetical protein AWC38_SpisGene25632, partial [Stylophora pistillata]